ncbi:MAG: Programmed cell death toxin YdcE [uncultured Rubrobacteraceae bacterium]|uniref:Programmed cell death toxin YdcE n=1 Tax=uncultured Rubrobacteraceae bacterium TaxID=349277 RepID=A0A6J4NBG7_9ACTN|nr:MAG: Programmed cell death toxin YdcE [uncultured Rubrobacteraceae bacterium]
MCSYAHADERRRTGGQAFGADQPRRRVLVRQDDQLGPVPGYPHPHVVVQDDVFNRSRIATVVVCALTSNLHRANGPGNVLLEAGEGNLLKRSVVVVSQISSVDKASLGERIGTLSAARVEQILAGLRFQQASFFGR